MKFDKNNTLPYSIFLQRSSKQVLTTKSIQPLFDPWSKYLLCRNKKNIWKVSRTRLYPIKLILWRKPPWRTIFVANENVLLVWQRWKISGYHRRTIDPYRRRKSDITFSLITSVILGRDERQGMVVASIPRSFLRVHREIPILSSFLVFASILSRDTCMSSWQCWILSWCSGKLIMSQQIFVKYWHCAVLKFRRATLFQSIIQKSSTCSNLDSWNSLEIDLCEKS